MTRRAMRMKKKRSHAQTSAIFSLVSSSTNQLDEKGRLIGPGAWCAPGASWQQATNRRKRRFQFSTRSNDPLWSRGRSRSWSSWVCLARNFWPVGARLCSRWKKPFRKKKSEKEFITYFLIFLNQTHYFFKEKWKFFNKGCTNQIDKRNKFNFVLSKKKR